MLFVSVSTATNIYLHKLWWLHESVQNHPWFILRSIWPNKYPCNLENHSGLPTSPLCKHQYQYDNTAVCCFHFLSQGPKHQCIEHYGGMFTRCATFLLTIPTSTPDLPSHGEAPQVDHIALHTLPTKHVP